jgi:hypothetical protein
MVGEGKLEAAPALTETNFSRCTTSAMDTFRELFSRHALAFEGLPDWTTERGVHGKRIPQVRVSVGSLDETSGWRGVS